MRTGARSDRDKSTRALRYAGVVFDLDGTLTRPVLDFRAMSAAIGLEGTGDIAEEIAALPPAERQRAWGIVEAYEESAMLAMRVQPGARALLVRCQRAGLRVGVLTRNRAEAVACFEAAVGVRFDAVVTRAFPHLKPRPEPLLHIARQWGLAPSSLLMVGDYLHDLECGRAAGAATCFLWNAGYADFSAHADHAIRRLAELRPILFGNG